MISFDPRPRHTRKEDRNMNPHSIARGPTFRLHVLYHYEPHRRSTSLVQNSLQFKV